jgi:hypothetical protein
LTAGSSLSGTVFLALGVVAVEGFVHRGGKPSPWKSSHTSHSARPTPSRATLSLPAKIYSQIFALATQNASLRRDDCSSLWYRIRQVAPQWPKAISANT